MRLLTLICAMLVLLNVMIFFWPHSIDNAPHIYAEKSDVNPHFVRLNKEIEDKHYAQSKVKKAPEKESGATVTVESDCYRIGPFMHQSNYELAQAVLFNAEVNYKKSKRESKESNVYRVYLGPYSSQAEVADVRVELKRKKVLDHFVRKRSEGDFIVSLGIYTTVETAETAVSLFDGKLSGVQYTEELVVLPDSYWLHFSLEEGDRIHQQLAQIDWGEQSAKMGKFQCEI